MDKAGSSLGASHLSPLAHDAPAATTLSIANGFEPRDRIKHHVKPPYGNLPDSSPSPPSTSQNPHLFVPSATPSHHPPSTPIGDTATNMPSDRRREPHATKHHAQRKRTRRDRTRSGAHTGGISGTIGLLLFRPASRSETKNTWRESYPAPFRVRWMP